MSTLLVSLLAQTFAAFWVGSGVRFTYDEERWELVKSQDEKTLVTLQRKAPDERYYGRFSVVIDDAKSIPEKAATPLLAYGKHARGFLETQRFQIQSEKKTTLSKEPALEINAYQRDFGLSFRQIIVVRGEKAYLATAAVRTSQVEKYQKELTSLFQSLSFENSPLVQSR